MDILKKKPNIGIDLGTSDVKIVGLRRKGGGGLNLEFYEHIDLVREYSLQLFDKITDEHYIEQLEKLVTKYDLKNCQVCVTLPANSAIMQAIKVAPSQTQPELLEKIHYELSKSTAGYFEEMQIACHELEDPGVKDKIPLLVCAIPKSVLGRFKGIINKVGLKSNIVELDALAIYNAFFHFSSGLNLGASVLIHIGSHYSTCIIIIPEKSPFFHLIKLGGNAATKNLSDEMFSNNLLSEVKKSMRHIQSHEGLSAFEKIYITGGGWRLDAISGSFKENLQVETEVWNPLEQLVEAKNGKTDLSGFDVIAAIGTALRED